MYPRFGPFGHVGTQMTQKGISMPKRVKYGLRGISGPQGPFGAISCHMGPNRPIWPVFGLYLAYLAYMGPGRPKGSYLDPPGQRSELNGYKLTTLRIGGPQIRPNPALRGHPDLGPLFSTPGWQGAKYEPKCKQIRRVRPRGLPKGVHSTA